MRAPDRLETARLTLRRPKASDAPAIFARYASDADVTRWLGWPRHTAIADTEGFLGFETPHRAQTGYVLARDAWGQGFATEALRAIVDLSPSLGVVRLYAMCHTEHAASAHVLDKCGFTREGVFRRQSVFPNSGVEGPLDVLVYARTW